MVANFTIRNDSAYEIRDIEIVCDHYARSGTRIDRNERTIYDIVPAKRRRTFRNFNMGFIHSQVQKSGCRIADLVVGSFRPDVEQAVQLIRDVQRELNELGYEAGPADGVMGPKTRAAIRAYQRRKGLQQDGRATKSLLGHLRARHGKLVSEAPETVRAECERWFDETFSVTRDVPGVREKNYDRCVRAGGVQAHRDNP